MFAQISRIRAISAVAGFASLICVSPANGGVILDWLCGRQTDADEQVIARYPPTACYDPCDPCNACNPCVSYPAQPMPCAAVAAPARTVPGPVTAVPSQSTPQMLQPTPIYTAPALDYGAAPMVQPPAQTYTPPTPRINPIPQTYYKTNWKRVPVTSYRPVVSTDPVTGYPLTVMKPCVTYTWQAERVPEGFFSRLFRPLWQPAPTPNVCVSAPVCCSQPALTRGPSRIVQPIPSGMTTGPVPTPAVAAPTPYYDNSSAPVQVPPPPATGPAPGSLAPPSGSSAVPGQPGGGSEPADRAPSLKPADGADSGPKPGSVMTHKPAPMTDLNLNGTNENSKQSSVTPPEAPRGSNLRLRPIPDPSGQTQPPSNPDAPQLLNPGDRVATRNQIPAGARTAIIWPASLKRALPPQTTDVRPIEHRTSRTTRPSTWDDSGWHTVRK